MNFSSQLSSKAESVEESSWVRLPGKNIAFLQKKWIELFRQSKLETADDFFSVVGEPLSKPGLGNRYRARLSLSQQHFYLKRYEGETLSALLSRWWEDAKRTSPAEREVNVALALSREGIAASAPVAHGRSGNRVTTQKSFVVTAAVPGDSLENFFRGKKQIPLSEKLKILQAVATFARKFHDHGWRHRDFYLCHIFISNVDRVPPLTLIDLARVFRPRWRKERWRIKDLAQLNYSASSEIFSRADRLRFVRHYFGCDKLNESQKILVRKIIKKTQAISRHDRKVGSQ